MARRGAIGACAGYTRGVKARHNSTNSTAVMFASCIEWRTLCSERADAGAM